MGSACVALLLAIREEYKMAMRAARDAARPDIMEMLRNV